MSDKNRRIRNAAHPAYLSYTAKRAGVKRFIHGGSCSVYGYTVNELYDETSPANSSYPYGISKLQGEFGCLKQADDSFSVIAFHQGTVCGYSPLEMKNIHDFRNYKVSGEKAANILSFKPHYDAGDIVADLVKNHEKFSDMDTSAYYNIRTFKEQLAEEA